MSYFDNLRAKQAAERAQAQPPEPEPARLRLLADDEGLHPWAARAVGEELARLDALARPWHEGARWDATTFEVACSLREIANTATSGYTIEQAQADLLAHAPADQAWGERQVRAKWRSAEQRVGDEGRPVPRLSMPQVTEDPGLIARAPKITERPDVGDVPTEGEGEISEALAELRERLTFVDGAQFILESARDVAIVWGDGPNVLQAAGEALLMAGGQGAGKTTLAQQWALGRCGAEGFGELLGLPVIPGEQRTLYLAMDRPRQAARAFARLVGLEAEKHRAMLEERLRFWVGPPLHDLARNTWLLTEMAHAAGADSIIVDSIKDAAIGLNEDEVGAGWNRARQRALTEGVEILELHHNRKRMNGDKNRTLTIDDIFGSSWITAGTGSVILLSGNPGDPIVDLHHVKQPMEEVGPLQVLHDHGTGRSTVYQEVSLIEAARAAADSGGLTARAAALLAWGGDDRSQRQKARRRLESLEQAGHLVRWDSGDKAGNEPARWGPA